MSRELLGYGQNYPRGRWPYDARLAISLELNYEEGAEQCTAMVIQKASGWGSSSTPRWTRRPGSGHQSTFEYGAALRLAGARSVPRLQCQGDDLCLWPCGRAESRYGEGLHGVGTSQRRMAICGATTSGCLKTRSGRRWPGRSCDPPGHRGTSARLVLPVCAERAYASAPGGRRRIPLRLRFLCRRKLPTGCVSAVSPPGDPLSA